VVSSAVDVKINSLPPYDGENEFSGLVGRFKIESSLDKLELAAGESATLTVVVSGSGNVMDVSPPKLKLAEKQFKVYNDNPVDEVRVTDKGIWGTKTFKSAIVPVTQGKFTITPVSLTFFDVEQKQYRTVSTLPYELSVSKSEAEQVAQPPEEKTKKGTEKQEVTFLNKDILDIKEGLEVLENDRDMSVGVFSALLFGPFGFFLMFKLFMSYRTKEKPLSLIMEQKGKAHLKKAGNSDPTQGDFLSHLYTGIVSLIYAKAGKKGETITINEAQTILDRAHVKQETISDVTQMLDTIESYRFGNREISKAVADELLKNAKQIIKLICLCFIAVTFFSFQPQNAWANDGAVPFLEGVQQYKNGEFASAADNFEKLVKTGIRNPRLYYNIGNSYLKNKEIGKAILWYERAKLTAPNDPDLRFNLAFANSLVKDSREDGSVSLKEIIFFWQTIIPSKYLKIFAIAFSFIFFTWAGYRSWRQKRIFSGTGLILFCLVIFTAMAVFLTYADRLSNQNAVIIPDTVSVRSGIMEDSTKLFDLHSGTKVKVEDVRQGFVKIRFEKGKIGWVKSDSAHIIEIL